MRGNDKRDCKCARVEKVVFIEAWVGYEVKVGLGVAV